MPDLTAIARAPNRPSRVLGRTGALLVPITAAASAGLAISSGAASAQGPTGRYVYGPPMMGGWGGSWYGMVLGPLMMVLVIVAVVLLVRWLAGPWPGGASHLAPPAAAPLDILKARFARGEIDKEEFAERKRVLGE